MSLTAFMSLTTFVFRKPFVIAALMGLLFALAGTATHAQTSTTWTTGTAYLDKTNPANAFTISNGPGQSNSIVPAPNPTFNLNASYASSLPQGANDSSGAGPVFQPYIWNGGSARTPLNYSVTMGAAASGMGSYQSTIDIHINSPAGALSVGGSAPPAYSRSSSLTISDAVNGGIGSVTGNVYTVAVHMSGDARMYGSGSSAHAGATATFSNPT